jgi:hypothetical protein
MITNDFDVIALYEALDAQRRERGLSWQRVAMRIVQRDADVQEAPAGLLKPPTH